MLDAMRAGSLWIGTSGYAYRHWRALLYPEGLAVDRWLARYAAVFRTVELNATFYRLASERAARNWQEATPSSFVFACKGSRYLTHMKRLTDDRRGVGRFFRPLRPLGAKFAAVLWQLPPQMNRPDPARLARFIERLPDHVRYAFEFRDQAWYSEEVCAVLDEHGVAFCEHDLVKKKILRPTGGFRYLRFHGTAAKYDGRYGSRALAPVARDLLRWQASGRDAYVYFNNDSHGHALYDAARLSELVGDPVVLSLPRAPRRR